MPNIYNESPFYERDNIVKNYFKLLAIPGRYAQASEFTEIQSILLSCIKSIGDSLFKDGNIQSGCELVLKDNVVTITPGRIYLDGIVRDTKEATVTLTGVGTEAITARLEERLVSEADDTSLLDPATTSSSAFQPGCYRVKQDVIFEVNGNGYSIATFLDGKIQNFIVEKPQMDIISEVLARRTFAESGNYIVSGFNLKPIEHEKDGKLLVGLEQGQAFIKGFEVYKPTDSTFWIDKSLVTRDVIGEPKIYSETSKTFSLINNPINTIDRVFVTVSASDTLNFSKTVFEYDLKNTPVADIQSVSSGDTTYIKNVDYRLYNNMIVWIGTTPTSGTNFTVNYTYKKALVKNTDYTVSTSNNVTNITITNTSIALNSEVLIDYSYYLARCDTICIDSEGTPIVIKGVEGDLDDCVAPRVDDLSYLSIGTILVQPNSLLYTVTNDTVRVSTMRRIQNAIERLDNLEYNIALTTLDQEILAQENTEQLRGLFTEAFVNFDRADLTHEDTTYSIIASDGIACPVAQDTAHNLSLANHPNNSYGMIGDVYTLPYTTQVALSQDATTGTMLVNPYQAFDPIMTINITPSVDSWINEVVTYDNQVITRRVNHAWWSDYYRATGGSNGMWAQTGHTTNIDRVTSERTSIVSEKVDLYMRQRDVKVVSTTFPPTCDNVRCLFNGIAVSLTPLNSTLRGTSSGSVRPDANGLIEASFKVPSKVPCGTVEVELYDGNLRGFAQYKASGLTRNIRKTIITERVSHVYVDPLAQTFSFNRDTILTGVDLYFQAKDDEPMIVQVRNVELGLPGKIIYAETSVPASKINISNNGTAVTHVDFPNIVQCEKDVEYCFIIMTTSPVLNTFIAELGEKTLDGKAYVTSNPYTAGVLLSSSNASTWTPHQSMDLKFKLYRADFSSVGELNFANITMNNADRLLYAIDTLRGVYTNAIVYANINNEGYSVVQPWSLYDLTKHATSCEIKIALSTEDSYLSPFVNRDSAQLISFVSDNKLTYISKNISLDAECQELKVFCNVSSNTNVTTKMYYATDSIGESWVELTAPKEYVVDVDTKQLEFKKDGLTINNFRIKIECTTTNTCFRPFLNKLAIVLNEAL